MANYIPVLDRPLFHAGLVVFAVGIRGAGAAQHAVRAAPGHALRTARVRCASG
jgi:hypothetical protein